MARDDVAASTQAASVPMDRIVFAESGEDLVWYTLDEDVRIVEWTRADRHGGSLRMPLRSPPRGLWC